MNNMYCGGLVLDEGQSDVGSQKISETALKTFVGGATSKNARRSHGQPMSITLSMKIMITANIPTGKTVS